MEKRLKILWLPAWYPSEVDNLNGDFIERHAKATSEFADICVIYVQKNATIPINTSQIKSERINNLLILRAYYNYPKKNKNLNKIISVYEYFILLFKLFKKAKKEYLNFDLWHVHISLRQGILALYSKLFYKTKYIISEQNSWFMPGGNKFYTNSFIQNKIIAANFKYASAVHTVSKNLGIQLQKRFDFIRSFVVIPNVVDTNVFYLKEDKKEGSSPVLFFAVTSDTYHKNTDGIIRSFHNYLKKGFDGLLKIAGPNTEELQILANQLLINDKIIFTGPVSNASIAQLMQECDVFVFFTRYETFGCVLAEALCCGKPVIASKIPVLEENLSENIDTIFVNSEDEVDLTNKMVYFAQNKNKFQNKKISETATLKYNYHNIGLEFMKLYLAVLKQK